MSKIKVDLLSNACQNLAQDSSSKFWGLLCVLSAIEGTVQIKPGITYRINTIKLSKNLERLFYFGDSTKSYSDSSNYVTFSSEWVKKACDIFTDNSVSIKDAALFFNIEKEVDEGSDISSIVEKFITEIKLSPEDVENLFDTHYDNEKNIVENGDYTKNTLWLKIKTRLNLNTNNTTLTMESPYTVVSHPAELSRAPFFQSLYAAQSNFECLLLTKFDFNELYKLNKTDVNSDKESTSLTKQRIYFGAPGTGKSHTIKNDDLKGVADDCVFRTTFHPDSDYSSFVGCYKPITRNGRTLRTDYTIDDLAAILNSRYESASIKTTALHSFALEYADYFNGKIASYSKKELVIKADLSEDYKVEINKIINLNQWMVDNSYMSTPSTISYEFSPEVFTNAYVEAWNNPTKPIYLIIEEINRGNCAQVFGDIFQLLDREDGVSEYAIKADAALCQYLQRSLRGEGLEGIKDGKLKLPSNLSILATMNTSDQSLFPMDSAFKRRWEWEFIPINSSEVSYAKIVIDSKEYSWSTFIEKVNKKIMNTCKSEDKQLGAFFIKVSKEKPEIDWKLFRSKVMSFLWFDVYKDLYESDENTVFRYYKDDKQEESVEFSFGKLFDGEEKKQIKLLQDFMEYINKE